MSTVDGKLRSFALLSEIGSASGATAGFKGLLDSLGDAFLRDLEVDGYALLQPGEGGKLEVKTSSAMDPVLADAVASAISESDLDVMARSDLTPFVMPPGTKGAVPEGSEIFCIPLQHRSRLLGILAVTGKPQRSLETGGTADVLRAVKTVISESLANADLIGDLVELTSLIEGILRSMKGGLVAVDAGGKVTYFNSSAEAILGLKAQDVVGRGCEGLLRTPGAGVDLLLEALRGECGEKELSLVSASGDETPVSLCLSQIAKDDGSVGGALAIFNDLTDAKRMQELMQRKDRLAYLGELSARVAHEIRNPLAGIGTSAEVLRKRIRDDADKVKFVDVILEEVLRLDKIIDNLLLFARPASPRLARRDLRDCVDKAIGLLKDVAADQGVRITDHWPEDLSHVYVDQDQMLQVLLNLCRNSLQAMESGGELEFRAAHVDRELAGRKRGRRATDAPSAKSAASPAKFLRLEIRDTGRGIKEADLPKLFDPFFTTKSKGTGLGLSISQAIVREHGGEIYITSVDGEGTVAAIEIPVEKRHGERRRNG
jgi:PAS domain S-box-containing protein